jgi:tRNA1(Val) A37 N6-methylase TrmN6
MVIGAATADLPPEPTVDVFLGGRVEAVQPADGRHRSGLEAVLLAAAIDSEFAGTVIDLGAGVGVAGMAVAARCPGTRVVLAERDQAAIDCAREALARPANRALAERVGIVVADVTDPEHHRVVAGLGRGAAGAVIINPPFFAPGEGSASPDRARAAAHVLGEDGLEPWCRTAASLLAPHGELTVIFRADGLTALLGGLGRRFGAVDILPIHPRATLPAHRILVRAVKGSRAGLRMLPPFTLHGAAGSAYLPEAEAILRHGAALAEVHPAWRRRDWVQRT